MITALDECSQERQKPWLVTGGDDPVLEHKAYSLENEMVRAFDANARERLESVQRAIERLVLLSKTYNPHSVPTENESHTLIAHQKVHLVEAKKDAQKRVGSTWAGIKTVTLFDIRIQIVNLIS